LYKAQRVAVAVSKVFTGRFSN